MRNKHIVKIINVFLLLSIISCQDYKAKEAEKCDGIDVQSLQLDGEARVE